jgi:hypothetical protein
MRAGPPRSPTAAPTTGATAERQMAKPAEVTERSPRNVLINKHLRRHQRPLGRRLVGLCVLGRERVAVVAHLLARGGKKRRASLPCRPRKHESSRGAARLRRRDRGSATLGEPGDLSILICTCINVFRSRLRVFLRAARGGRGSLPCPRPGDRPRASLPIGGVQARDLASLARRGSVKMF